MLARLGKGLRYWDWSCDGQGHFSSLLFFLVGFHLLFYFVLFYSFLALGLAFGQLDLDMGLEDLGGFITFFLRFFFGMVFVLFIFFLLSNLVSIRGVFFVSEGLRFFEGLVCRVV